MTTTERWEAWVETALDELYERYGKDIPWNDASGDYPEEGEVTEKEREDLEEVFPEYPHPSPCSKT